MESMVMFKEFSMLSFGIISGRMSPSLAHDVNKLTTRIRQEKAVNFILFKGIRHKILFFSGNVKLMKPCKLMEMAGI
jgi:hypothetical protein